MTSLDTALTTSQLRALVRETPHEELPALGALLVDSLVSTDDAHPPLTIGQVAALLDVTEHTLRWYERIGLVQVDRSPGGQRSYDADAIGRVIFITRLRLSDMPIADIHHYVELVERGPSTALDRRALLEEHRAALLARMDDLRFALAVIDYKIATYGGGYPADETGAHA